MSEFDGDNEFEDIEVVYQPLPRQFEKPVLLLPGLILLSSVARGVVEASELLIAAVESHVEFGQDMKDFHTAAAIEIETIVVGDEDA